MRDFEGERIPLLEVISMILFRVMIISSFIVLLEKGIV